MSSFSLRPVTHSDRSSSPSSSTASDRTPPHKTHTLPLSPRDSSRPRRPLSPSIPIRDLDLPIDRNAAPRKYPAPPTGHELMALFPPPPPVTFPTGPTSGYFQKEERAFFAQAGKEIVRVHIEVDLKEDEDAPAKATARPREGAGHHMARPWPANAGAHPQLHLPTQLPSNHVPPASFSPPTHAGRTPRPAHTPPSAPTVFQIPTHNPAQPSFPPNVHPSPNPQHAAFPLRTASHERPHLPVEGGKTLHEDFRDDPDEAWRRPTPHNQRRRAGKHTKRVVVK